MHRSIVLTLVMSVVFLVKPGFHFCQKRSIKTHLSCAESNTRPTCWQPEARLQDMVQVCQVCCQKLAKPWLTSFTTHWPIRQGQQDKEVDRSFLNAEQEPSLESHSCNNTNFAKCLCKKSNKLFFFKLHVAPQDTFNFPF